MSERPPAKIGGRFIKRQDPLLKSLSVAEFSLEDISQSITMLPDNSEANIIHTYLHHPASIASGVRDPQELKRDLASPEMKRPVLRPLDFTEDWKRQKRRSQNRGFRFDEEEELERELELASKRAEKQKSSDDPVAAAAPSEVHAAISDPAELKTEPTTMSINDVGRAIRDFASNESAKKIDTDENEIVETSKDPEFVPFQANANEAVHNPEQVEIANYQQKQKLKFELTQDDRQLVEEAKSAGYQDGYRLGEEKAGIKSRETLQVVSQALGSLLKEAEGLKNSVLKNAQDNFTILAQAMIESLLRREFALHPETFQSVVERAIQEASPDDQFKVKVNRETFAALQDVAPAALSQHLVVDESMKDWDFRIESQLAIVDAKVTELISDLLQQADVTLFSGGAKAS